MVTKAVLETGRWWEDDWWEGNYRLDHPVEKVQAAVHTLREFFTAEWTLGQFATGLHHPIIVKLCFERGRNAAHFLVSTAECFRLLSDANGFARKFTDLASEKYWATWLELETAAMLVGSGCAVEFPAESESKTPDIIATTNGQTVAIECKRLEEERWEGLMSDLMRKIIFAIPDKFEGREIVVKISLEDRLSEILVTDADINKAILEEIGGRVKNAVLEALRTQHLPIDIKIAGIGKALILPKDQGLFGSIDGMHVSRTAKLRRTLQNGLFRAVEQLQGDLPGIVVINSDFAPDAELARTVFDAITRARRDTYRNILAMIIVPRIDGHQIERRLVLENMNSEFSNTRFHALEALKTEMKLTKA